EIGAWLWKSRCGKACGKYQPCRSCPQVGKRSRPAFSVDERMVWRAGRSPVPALHFVINVASNLNPRFSILIDRMSRWCRLLGRIESYRLHPAEEVSNGNSGASR